jgi:hypothetical protein
MKKLRLALATVSLLASSAQAQVPTCQNQGDAGNTTCMAGMLYRCVCRQIQTSTSCAWNNAAVACTAFSGEDLEQNGKYSTPAVESPLSL